MSFLSLEKPERSRKSLKFPKDNDYVNETIRSLKKNYTHPTNVNIQKSNSGDRSRRRHTDHSVHTPRSSKHHLLSNADSSYTDKQNFGDNSSINLRSPTKSLNSSRSSYVSSKFGNSDSSKKSYSDGYVSNPSYLAVLERRRTAEHAELLIKQAEERTQRKLKLLQKIL